MSNVGHHGRFAAHSLRSALNQMHLLCSASFHSSEATKYRARLPLLVSWFRGSFAGSFFTLSTAAGSSTLRSAKSAHSVTQFGVSQLALPGTAALFKPSLVVWRSWGQSRALARQAARWLSHARCPTLPSRRDVQELSLLAAPHVKR